MRLYVVVSGPPGSGKSSLGRALADELDLPLFAKDTIKEALMRRLDVPDVEGSRRLGGAAVEALLAVAAEARCGVLESVWHPERAAPELRTLGGQVVEVFCRCTREVARARYAARAPMRAAGHFDALRVDDELWNDDVARPVAGGWPVLEVDTERLVDVRELAARIRGCLSR